MYLDIDEELDRIDRSFTYMDDHQTWLAFLWEPRMKKAFNGLTYLNFARDAARSVKRVHYDVPYGETLGMAVSEYKVLLKKYNYPEDMVDYSVYLMIRQFLNGRIDVYRRTSINEHGTEKVPEVPEGDIDNVTMATIFANLPPQPEVAAYLAEISVDYDYDHLHMVSWFSGQMTHGKGNYSRREHNFSAKRTYNRLLNPYSLMWIGAVLGEDPEIIRKAAADASQVKTYAEKCGIVRRAVPFERIYELAMQMKEKEDSVIKTEESEGR